MKQNTPYKKQIKLITTYIAILVVSLSIVFLSCTKKTTDLPEITPNKVLFEFDYQDIKEFTISKFDPESSDKWTAQFNKQNEESHSWVITSAPNGQTLKDNLANHNFISHVLDTLTTLRVSSIAPNGPLSSFGLDAPFFALRWVNSNNKVFEIRLGTTSGKTTQRFGYIPSIKPKVFLAEGAALEMLSRIKSFEFMRRQTLSTIEADDVFEFEVRKGGAKGELKFLALRDGDDWHNKQKKPLDTAQTLIDEISHLRIKSYVDDELLVQKISKSKPTHTAILKDRHDAATTITITIYKGSVYATTSSRQGVFELYTESLRFFELR